MLAQFAINANENEFAQIDGAELLSELLGRPVSAREVAQREAAGTMPRPFSQPRQERLAAQAPRGKAGRFQKTATRQIAAGRYSFTVDGHNCEVVRKASDWQLIIDGTEGRKRFETKRHAVNFAAKLIREGGLARRPAAVQAETIAAPEVAAAVVQPVAVPEAKPAAGRPAGRVNWRNENAPWRKEAATRKQRKFINHLFDQCGKYGVDTKDLPAAFANRGEASDLIDEIKRRLGRSTKAQEIGKCSIGPFARGYCVCCGLKQAE